MWLAQKLCTCIRFMVLTELTRTPKGAKSTEAQRVTFCEGD